jgi:hypothetical protein
MDLGKRQQWPPGGDGRPHLALRALQFFEGRLVEGDLKTGGHILQATSGSGPNRQVFNYSTDRVVGNGSFGVVFQATCLETGETVRALGNTPQWHVPTHGTWVQHQTGHSAATGRPLVRSLREGQKKLQQRQAGAGEVI